MAVIKTIETHRGRRYCLLIDPNADTVAVLAEQGFDADDFDNDPTPAYFEEIEGDPTLFVRIDEATEEPVGLMVEHASKREGRRWLRRPRRSLEVFDFLFELAHAALWPPEATESFLDEPQRAAELRRGQYGWQLETAGIGIER